MSKSQDCHPTLFGLGLRLVLGGSVSFFLLDFLDEELRLLVGHSCLGVHV